MTGVNSFQKLSERLNIDFALQAAGLGIWEYDPSTDLVLWDERCRALFGLAADNRMSYEQAFEHIHPDDAAQVDQAAQWVMNPRSDGSFDQTFRTIGVDDGKLRWVHFQGRVDFTATGEVLRFAGVAQEVTQQVVAQQQLEESEARFRSLIEESPLATMLLTGPTHLIELANPPMMAMLGKGAAILGKPAVEAVPELAAQAYLDLLNHVLTSGETYQAQAMTGQLVNQGVTTTHYFDFTYKPMRTPAGEIYGILAVAIDVTEQVLSRQQTEASEQLLRDLVLGAPVGIGIVNAADLVIERVNDAFIEVAGKHAEQLVGHYYWVPFAEAAPYYAQALSRVAQEGEAFSVNEVELTLIRPGKKETIFVTFFYMPLGDGAGKVEKIIVWVVENTHQVLSRRKVEQLVDERTHELNEANQALALINEALAASNEEYAAINEELLATNENFTAANQDLIRSNQNLEQFAYIASHDLQEPLRKIQQFGDLLKTRFANSVSGEEVIYLERMQSAASRMSSLIKDLLAFSRIATTQVITVPVVLNELVTQVLENLSVAIEESGAQIEVNALPTVQGDPLQLSQLFQNLLSNALKFHHPGVAPQIHISSQALTAQELSPAIKPVRKVPLYCCITVRDNGVGFEEKYVDRIFQVFQRLHGKNEFAGTGVGLAIVQKVVANHGGAISGSGKPNQGATFRVYLPA